MMRAVCSGGVLTNSKILSADPVINDAFATLFDLAF